MRRDVRWRPGRSLDAGLDGALVAGALRAILCAVGIANSREHHNGGVADHFAAPGAEQAPRSAWSSFRSYRRPIVLAVITAILAGSSVTGWWSVAAASARSIGYQESVEFRESLAVDAYDTIAGSAFFWATARRLVAGKTTDKDRLQALLDWTHENVRPQFAGPSRLVSGNFSTIVRRGYGYCDQDAHVFATLAFFAGYEVHLLFLFDANGSSPHTVAEVRVDGRWILADPWLGVLFLDHDGELAGTAELGTTAEIPQGYATLDFEVDRGLFLRGVPFESYPYQSLPSFVAKVGNKLLARPAVDVPDLTLRTRTVVTRVDFAWPTSPPATEAPPAAAAAPEGEFTDGALIRSAEVTDYDLSEVLLELDAARWAHLEGRYRDAISGYRGLLARGVPADLAQSTAFFLGLAQLRAGSPQDAVVTFGAALRAYPNTEWRPSVLFYRAEAKLALGDLPAAVKDLRDARIPSALQKLATLGAL